MPCPAVWLAGLLVLSAGCSRRETPAAAGVRTQTLLVGNASEPADLDPQTIVAYTDANIVNSLFEGLTWIDPRTSLPVPAAAARWDESPDGLVYTFHLRRDARWSDGNPVTAGDFVFSIHRILTPAFAANFANMLWPIKNARGFNAGKISDFSLVGAKALDPLTLQITLERPTAYLPALVANQAWYPVPRRIIERFGPMDLKGSAWTRPGNLVGNGPFRLVEWTPNARIVVEKNPYYWGAARCRLQRIEFFPIDNPAVEELAFRAGQLDVTAPLPGLPISKIAAYRAEIPSRLRIEPLLATDFLVFNTTRPPFDRPAVRRALSLAIDRDAIVALYHGSVVAARGLTPPHCGGYTMAGEPRDDAAAARKLLAGAGFPGGKGFPTIDVLSYNDENHRRALEAIQAMWRQELGVHITITPLEQRTLFQTLQSRGYTIGFMSWVADYADPFDFLQIFVSDDENNSTGWSNRDYDRLLGEASRTADPSRRFALLRRAEAILLADPPFLPTVYNAAVHAVQPMVHGWRLNLLGYQRYQDVWLANE
jgi:oligopeptide transport system substrate-binding protein